MVETGDRAQRYGLFGPDSETSHLGSCLNAQCPVCGTSWKSLGIVRIGTQLAKVCHSGGPLTVTSTLGSVCLCFSVTWHEETLPFAPAPWVEMLPCALPLPTPS